MCSSCNKAEERFPPLVVPEGLSLHVLCSCWPGWWGSSSQLWRAWSNPWRGSLGHVLWICPIKEYCTRLNSWALASWRRRISWNAQVLSKFCLKWHLLFCRCSTAVCTIAHALSQLQPQAFVYLQGPLKVTLVSFWPLKCKAGSPCTAYDASQLHRDSYFITL